MRRIFGGAVGLCNPEPIRSRTRSLTQMGGQSSSTQTQQSQTAPWEAAQPMLQSILGQINPLIQNSGLNPTESGAIGQLSANAAQGNPYASQISSFAGNLLNGGGANAQAPNLQSGLSTLQSQ